MSILFLLATAAVFCAPVLGDAYGRLPHGPGFRNVRDYGARGDGVTDDTAAFIRALDDGRGAVREKAAANVYVPPGTYLLSDTLILWRATLLAGDADDPPTLVLKANSPGFDDPGNPKPLLVTACGYSIDPATRDYRTRTDQLGGSTNNTFFITMRHLRLRLEPGNRGAWGLWWLVAQQTSLRDVTIDAGESQGCVKSMWWGGGGVISHLRCLGGDYGWHVQETSQWVLRSATFSGQRKHALWLDHVWSFSLLDLHFRDTAPVRLLGGSVSCLDSTFEGIAGHAAIENEGANLILQNVRAQGVSEVVAGLLPAAATGETYVRRWAAGGAMVDGEALVGPAHDLGYTLPRPYVPLPSPPYPAMGAEARSVTEFGARGDGQTDDTRAVQAALDECREVFFPEGTYLVSDTLRLRPDSQLFGEMWSVIDLAADSVGFQEPTSRKPLLAVPDDPRATLTLCHLRLHMRTPGGIHFDWRAGPRSRMVDCTTYSDSPAQELNARISGRGAGFFENAWCPGVSGDGLEITSRGPTYLYAVQHEHYAGTALALRGARGVTALGLQFETSPAYVRVEGCEDVTLFQTIAGNWLQPVSALISVEDSRRVALLNSGITNAGQVIAEVPHGWNAGPASCDRSFAYWPAWIAD